MVLKYVGNANVKQMWALSKEHFQGFLIEYSDRIISETEILLELKTKTN